jgi:hypothetical protein
MNWKWFTVLDWKVSGIKMNPVVFIDECFGMPQPVWRGDFAGWLCVHVELEGKFLLPEKSHQSSFVYTDQQQPEVFGVPKGADLAHKYNIFHY